MKYLVAVSGGIDSVVLLHQLVIEADHQLVVAHFDHGIRDDSASDARFVAELASSYGLSFHSQREELGSGASEELARNRRYGFLTEVAEQEAAKIVTAHHSDDLIETIAINLNRGTGWRGVAVLDNPQIDRPLLSLSKADIRAYAAHHRLEWVEDSTNAEKLYLRNRLRRDITKQISLQQKEALKKLWQKQLNLKTDITSELRTLVGESEVYKRYDFITIPQSIASEILREVIVARTRLSPTRPQLERSILAIKTARRGSIFDVGSGVKLQFTTDTFIVQTP